MERPGVDRGEPGESAHLLDWLCTHVSTVIATPMGVVPFNETLTPWGEGRPTVKGQGPTGLPSPQHQPHLGLPRPPTLLFDLATNQGLP